MTVDGCITVETACGMSLIKLATKLTEGDLTIGEITNILTPAFRGGGNDVKNNDIAKIVYEGGLPDGMRVCGEILTNVLMAGKTNSEDDGESAEKNEQEVTQKEK